MTRKNNIFNFGTQISNVKFLCLVCSFFCTELSATPINDSLNTIILNSAMEVPMTTKNQDGFLDRVATEAFRRIGYKLIINKLPAERGLRNANAGLIDGELGRIGGLSKIYPNLIQVPEKITDTYFVAFSRKNVELKQGWQSLANKNLAFIKGWKIYENSTPKSAAITTTKNSKQLFMLLSRNRTDYVLFNRWGGRSIIAEMKLDDVKELSPPLAVKEMFIYLNKKHADLVPLVNKSLANMKSDGSYESYMKRTLKSK